MKSLLFILWFSVCNAIPTVTLKQNVVVKTERLRVSDFFDGVPESVDEELIDAPSIGTSKTFSYDWVDQLAINFNLHWPHKNRPSLTISREAIAQGDAVFVRDLISSYISSNDTSRFTNEIMIELSLNEPLLSSLKECDNPVIIEMQWPGQTHFVATFKTDSSNTPIVIKGSATEIISLPVAKKDLTHNHIIVEDDLEWKAVPITRITDITLRKQEDIIGNTIKNTNIKAGTPILKTYLKAPVSVHKGDVIQLKIDTPTLEISLRAKATSDGAIGETIQVMNLESKKIVDAVVVDAQTATIGV